MEGAAGKVVFWGARCSPTCCGRGLGPACSWRSPAPGGTPSAGCSSGPGGAKAAGWGGVGWGPPVPPPPPPDPEDREHPGDLRMLLSPIALPKRARGAAEGLGTGPGAGEGRRGGALRLPAPRGRPAGRCHRGLPSFSGCWHEPRWPWKGERGVAAASSRAGDGVFVRPQSTGGWPRGAWGAPGTLTRRQGRPESSPWSVVRLLWLTERCSCGERGGEEGAEPSGVWGAHLQPPKPSPRFLDALCTG